MARADRPDNTGREIRLVENPDGQWTARDLEAEVTAQGETRAAALAALDDVVAALAGEAGHEPTDEELRELGVEPDAAREQSDELPDILK
ncbi:type II toxin-antitoxin system HicB family antitoxin [Haloarcula sediminis]|uniref:type II toxin-antitoxin system HicB family antitoxin n=1 Tax=Haloarcula sediminis TaxID=3111777 RepID=UPI002D77D09B|nr:type II toxin-antitoxin system HicB family antitoxin [Haloarcula sp. CK38]